ncbi:MAG: LysR family transcriptional regulator [Pseudomonadota bacterium]
MYDIADLETFIEVVERGGVTAAAHALDIAPSTVSHRIAKIEKRLRTRLFHRDSRHFSPTDDGRQFWMRARDIVEALREAEQEAMGGASGVRGVLKVTLPPWVMNAFVAPRLAAFQADNPDLALEFLTTDRFVNLVEERQDLGVRVGALSDSALRAQKIADNERVICASPNYLRKAGEPTSIDALERHLFVVLPWQRSLVLNADAGGTRAITPAHRIILTDAEALTSAALNDVGLVVKSRLAISAPLAEGRLVEVLPGALADASAPIHLIRTGATPPPRKVSVFSDFLRDVFATRGANR